MRKALIILGSVLALALHGNVSAQERAIHSSFYPLEGKGTPVLVLSGQSGPTAYVQFARALSEHGFFVTLVNSNQFLNDDGQMLADTIVDKILTSPHSISDKIGVVGFSLGGRLAVSHAARMSNRVSGVVAYYPQTNLIDNAEEFVRRIRVPTLILAGVQDRHAYCCTIEMARRLADAAAGIEGTPSLLSVIEFAQAGHGFNLGGPSYRSDDAATAFDLTVDHLRAHSVPASRPQ